MGAGGRFAAVVVSLYLVLGVLAVLPVAPPTRADSVTWTSSADFLAGTLTDVDASSFPGDLVLDQQNQWVRHPSNPVVNLGPLGSWDDAGIRGGRVLYEGGVYKMWYTGCADTSGTCSIGYATSSDGVVWTKHPGNPVVPGTGSGWEASAWVPTVLNDSGTYKMWYAGSWTGPDLKIGYATSPNGIAWTKHPGNPIFLPTPAAWDSLWVHTPMVIREGASLTMWYSGSADNINTAIGRATSVDGIVWTKDAANPVVTPQGWEGARLYLGHVNYSGGTYTMHYWSGTSNSIGAATSSDGVAWTRDPGNPVFVPATPPSWDEAGAVWPEILEMGGVRRMWYAGSNAVNIRLGFATSQAVYQSQGNFTSAVFDSGGAGSAWNRLLWNATTPPSTEIGVSARAGDTPTPDGTWSAWTVPATASPAMVALPRTRYLQVNVLLTTSVSNVTPVLNDVSLDYTPNTALPPTLVLPSDASWTAVVPALQWRFEDVDVGDVQGAYHVQVDATPAFTTPPLPWDSGPVLSASNTSIPGVSLADGEWFWRVRTQDSWGLWGPYSAPTSFRLDSTPPNVTIAYGAPTLLVGSTRWVTPDTLLWLNASDGTGIGVSQVTYGFDGPPASVYAGPVATSLPDGPHTLTYTAADALGNALAVQTVDLVVDGTPPSVNVAYGSPTVLSGLVRYITPTTPVWLNAADSGVGGAQVTYGIDGSPDLAYTSPFSLSLTDGPHTITYTAVDALGNLLGPEVVSVVVDGTPPTVSVAFRAPTVLVGSTRYVTPITLIWLNATDGGVGGETLLYGIDGPAAAPYFAPFTLPLADGPHTITYTAVDALGNLRGPEVISVVVDGTSPAVNVGYGSPTVVSGSVRYITPTTLIWFNATDSGVGGAQVTYMIGVGPSLTYTAPFALPPPDEPHAVTYFAVDALGNAGVPQTAFLIVDTIGPVVSLSITPLERGYEITVDAVDAGAGTSTIFVSVDGAEWMEYDAPFIVDAFGTHTVRAYAVDLLGNEGSHDQVSFETPNWKPLVAGVVGLLGILLGLALAFSKVRRDRAWLAGCVGAGIVEVIIAVLSLLTGLLGIPPWVGVSLAMDIALLVAILLCAILWNRSPPVPAEQPPGPPLGTVSSAPPTAPSGPPPSGEAPGAPPPGL